MTREKRLEIYRAMLEIASKDLSNSLKNRCGLYGFCYLARKSSNNDIIIEDLPELMRYKPTKQFLEFYWFDTDPNGPDATKRIDILKEIINTMQNGKTQINQNS